jgi:hypothetical protein
MTNKNIFRIYNLVNLTLSLNVKQDSVRNFFLRSVAPQNDTTIGVAWRVMESEFIIDIVANGVHLK